MSEYEEARKALKDFANIIAKEFHLYDVLDWIEKRLRRLKNE